MTRDSMEGVEMYAAYESKGLSPSLGDVYHQWLGISPEDQSPSPSRLLGISESEADPAVISTAAERQTMHVRRLARGVYTDVGQQLLNRIAAAKLTLLRANQPNALVSRPPTGITIIDWPNLHAINPTADRWIIGYHPQCDVPIPQPTVSSTHCQIIRTPCGVFVTDLKSTNGTFINQARVHTRTQLRWPDLLTLGRKHRVVIPRAFFEPEHQETNQPSSQVLFVGRSQGNEIRLSSPSVSAFHARVVVRHGSAIIQDLNSAEGTFVASPGQPASRIREFRVRGQELIRFGEVEVAAQDLLDLRQAN